MQDINTIAVHSHKVKELYIIRFQKVDKTKQINGKPSRYQLLVTEDIETILKEKFNFKDLNRESIFWLEYSHEKSLYQKIKLTEAEYTTFSAEESFSVTKFVVG